MNHIDNVLEGFASIFGFAFPRGRTYRRGRNGFATDKDRLRGDVRQVGANLKKGLKKYGEQGVTCSSYK